MSSEKKSDAQELTDFLYSKKKNVWDEVQGGERQEIMRFNEDYKYFLNRAKTEREAVAHVLETLRGNGFQSLNTQVFKPVRAGTRFYFQNKNKALAVGIVGREHIKNGFHLIAAHVDSPRLDLKPNPVYEKEGLVYFNTHYYGGIKKYQWTTIPLALHGVIVKRDGNVIEVNIGERDRDPVFTICDLLPHLAKAQLKKKAGEAIDGENLDVLVGSVPYADKKAKERVKLALLEHLHREYGLVEEDFVSAEIEVVPAGGARDIGFDRGLVGAYGQDDRVCAYAALRALLDLKDPLMTTLVLLFDKEEIGSSGNTGAQSRFLEQVVHHLCRFLEGRETVDLLDVFANSKALSGDVNGALDPLYDDVMDKYNAAYLGAGVVLTKYTGSRGKYNANDARAEFMGQIRRLLNNNNIIWQTGELGKVDQGGGGTVAQYLAHYGLDVVDCGTPVLNMHSPLEVTSKADVYMTFRAYREFLAAPALD